MNLAPAPNCPKCNQEMRKIDRVRDGVKIWSCSKIGCFGTLTLEAGDVIAKQQASTAEEVQVNNKSDLKSFASRVKSMQDTKRKTRIPYERPVEDHSLEWVTHIIPFGH